jgi:hypothetical protein
VSHPLRDELEAVLRGWNAYETGRGAEALVDFDLRPDLTAAVPVGSRLAALALCEPILQRAEAAHDYWIAARARADVAYLRALLGEALPIEEYLRRTQACRAVRWPEAYLAARRELASTCLEDFGIDWGPATRTALEEAQGLLPLEEAEEAIREAADEHEALVRHLTGATAPFHLTVETADVDAFWGSWLDGAGGHIRLRLNRRTARFTRTRARQFALHDILGHGLQSANLARTCRERDVPWVRLCSVHAPHQILMEGLAQALPLLVTPEDQELIAAVRLDHYCQLVRGNLHLAINQGHTIEQCVRYAQSHVPFWTDEDVANLLTDRATNPLLRSYLWAYPAGFDWFVQLSESTGPVSTVLHAVYQQPATPAALTTLWPDGPALAPPADLDAYAAA